MQYSSEKGCGSELGKNRSRVWITSPFLHQHLYEAYPYACRLLCCHTTNNVNIFYKPKEALLLHFWKMKVTFVLACPGTLCLGIVLFSVNFTFKKFKGEIFSFVINLRREECRVWQMDQRGSLFIYLCLCICCTVEVSVKGLVFLERNHQKKTGPYRWCVCTWQACNILQTSYLRSTGASNLYFRTGNRKSLDVCYWTVNTGQATSLFLIEQHPQSLYVCPFLVHWRCSRRGGIWTRTRV